MSGTNPESRRDPTPAASGTHPDSPRELTSAAQISNLVVQALRAYTGRGPTKAWTSIHDDLISVVLRDTLTKGERSLVAGNQAELVLEMRKAYQSTMREELVAGVERITGRKVIAFLSDNHTDPDIAIESFVLEPLPDHEDPPQEAG
jgi:uncharacterized protein YbcI